MSPAPTTPTGNPALDGLLSAVAAAETVEASALTFANGVPGLIQAGINQALANGATAAQLAPLAASMTQLQASNAALQAALVANTPSATPADKPKP